MTSWATFSRGVSSASSESTLGEPAREGEGEGEGEEGAGVAGATGTGAGPAGRRGARGRRHIPAGP